MTQVFISHKKNFTQRSKLMCVKKIKELAGLGLKESKAIVDELDYKDVVAFDSVYFNGYLPQNYIDDFEKAGYNVSCNTPRDLNINKVMSIFTVKTPSNTDWEIMVFDGSYTIENQVITVNIIDGVVYEGKNKPEESITNSKMEFCGNYYITKKEED